MTNMNKSFHGKTPFFFKHLFRLGEFGDYVTGTNYIHFTWSQV